MLHVVVLLGRELDLRELQLLDVVAYVQLLDVLQHFLLNFQGVGLVDQDVVRVEPHVG